MAENCELKHRLTLAKVTSATLQAKHDTLRHNFVTLHRVAVSKLRQRDAEIGVLRKRYSIKECYMKFKLKSCYILLTNIVRAGSVL